MSGYGYYGEEGESLYAPQGQGLLTGGGTRSFAIFDRSQLQGKSRAERLKIIRQAKKVPALAWGIRKWNRKEIAARKKNPWLDFVREKLRALGEEYRKGLPPEKLAAYEARKKKAEEAKTKKLEKIQIVKQYLESLKGKNPRETAMYIADALAREGTANARLLRTAMKLVYPELYGNLKGKQLTEAMKDFTVRGAPKYAKPRSAMETFVPKVVVEQPPPQPKQELKLEEVPAKK
jgi:hypothetical protein